MNKWKNFDILATSLTPFNIIILIVQQNYFSDSYLAKIIDFSAKPFFSCTYWNYLRDLLELKFSQNKMHYRKSKGVNN